MAETVQPRIVKDLWGDKIIAGLYVNTDKVILWKNDLTPDNATVVGDLTEADFTGYAAFTLGDTPIDGQAADNREQITVPTILKWKQTGTTITNTVYGWAWVDTTKAVLKAIKRLDTPVLFDATDVTLMLKIFTLMEITAGDHQEVTT